MTLKETGQAGYAADLVTNHSGSLHVVQRLL